MSTFKRFRLFRCGLLGIIWLFSMVPLAIAPKEIRRSTFHPSIILQKWFNSIIIFSCHILSLSFKSWYLPSQNPGCVLNQNRRNKDHDNYSQIIEKFNTYTLGFFVVFLDWQNVSRNPNVKRISKSLKEKYLNERYKIYARSYLHSAMGK